MESYVRILRLLWLGCLKIVGGGGILYGSTFKFLVEPWSGQESGAPCSLWCVCVVTLPPLLHYTITPHPLYTFLYHSLIYHYILCVEIGHKNVEIAYYKCVEIGHKNVEIVIYYIYLKIC